MSDSWTYAIVIIADADKSQAQSDKGTGYFIAPLSADGNLPVSAWMTCGPWGNDELQKIVNAVTWKRKMYFGTDWQSAIAAEGLQQCGIPSVTECKLKALQLPLVADPGERWEYGVNIDWAGRIVELVSGQPLEAYLQEHMFGPLGMRDTTFVLLRFVASFGLLDAVNRYEDTHGAQFETYASQRIRGAILGAIAGGRFSPPSAEEIAARAGAGPVFARMLQAALEEGAIVEIAPGIVVGEVRGAEAFELTRAVNAWQQAGRTGKDVTVAVVDTGVDYTHADFGGPGLPAAYAAASQAAETIGDTWAGQPLFPTAKVVGGWDIDED